MTFSHPALNACLNGASALLLLAGYFFIRGKKITAHRICMGSAFITSVIFLISYLIYHFHHGSTRYSHTGIIRIIYFSILISHTLLAVVIVPLILVTFRRALRGDFQKHAAIARVTFPLWLYVSVTGVVIYWMLYQL